MKNRVEINRYTSFGIKMRVRKADVVMTSKENDTYIIIGNVDFISCIVIK
jgi:hypothetical protein